MNRKLTKERLIKAIQNSYGNVMLIAKKLKVARSSVYAAIERYGLQSLIEKERDELIDLAESKLVENIKSGKESSIIFALRTLGKKRGYTEKTEIDVNDMTKVTEILKQIKIYENNPELIDKRLNELKQELFGVTE